MVFFASLLLAALPSPEFTWTVVHSDASLVQTALPDAACSLRCDLRGKVAWSTGDCLVRATDFIFVSEDCGTVLTLNEYPLRGEKSGQTPVAGVLTAKGNPPEFTRRVIRLEELVDIARLPGEGRRVRWLAGVVGEPGTKPHLSTDGSAIEFSTLDGSTRSVRFKHPEDFLPKITPADPDMYQFVDAEGSTQFVMGLENVQPKFRKKATRVESELGAVEADSRPARAPPSRRSSEPSLVTLERSRPPPPPAAIPLAPNQPPAIECKIYGLSGPACTAVMIQRMHRGNWVNKSPPPLPPPRPPGSPYEPAPSPYR